TYAGHPLACASVVATINLMRDEKIVENAKMIGEDVIGPRLRELAEKHPSIGEVRGLGVFWAVEMVADRETREPLAPYGGSSEAMARTFGKAKSDGLLLFMNYNRFHVVPPCIITPDEANEGLDIFDRALDVADEYVRS
ncbi:MAG TPA: aspartate aminotransferase family protein, partial [Dietzia sp.]|nr:aspartate aminotransferase family protein [Dietzia sp.]